MSTIIDWLNGVMKYAGWPVIIYVASIAILCTIALKFVQLRYFAKAWRLVLFPEPVTEGTGSKKNGLTSMQAFIGALNASLGTGIIAGVATALCMGGPGAAFWMIVMGIILMAVRFVEVYASIHFSETIKPGIRIGGPMSYLRHVPGGNTLSYIYGVLCLLMGFIMACSIQTNSISLGVKQAWGISPYIVALVSLAFVAYVVLGGAQRVAKISDYLVPLKVGLFVLATTAVLICHYQKIIPALKIIIQGAFQPIALAGGAAGFVVQLAIQYGMMRTIMATESGLGSASILFGGIKSKEPVNDAIMAMLSTFISASFCFIMALTLVVSGAWNCGLEGTAIVSKAFQSALGDTLGGTIAVFLSVSFAMGVNVAYVYITREAWLFVTKGRFATLFNLVYCLFTAAGAIMSVVLLFSIADVIMIGMLGINLFGIIWLLPIVRKALLAYMAKQ